MNPRKRGTCRFARRSRSQHFLVILNSHTVDQQQTTMSQRPAYQVGTVRTSRRYLGNLRCPEGHRLYQYRPGVDGLENVSCDFCNMSIATMDYCFGCRQCNIDICSGCQQSGVTQQEVDRLTPNTRPSAPIQHCCMVAIVSNHTSEQDRLTAAARGERYNGRRPDYRGQRVSSRDYPDPTAFGWTFTGSCEGGRAEFFEKDFSQHGVVKLDFYYTTGTVKTVLDHPRQGVTQLFAKGNRLSPGMYRAILQNPRHHTGNRYHRK